jgi:hypothetical protein
MADTKAILFLTPGEGISYALESWFRTVAESANGHLSVQIVDRALDPALGRELDAGENGTVVLERGDLVRRYVVGEDHEAAGHLRQLDAAFRDMLSSLDAGHLRVRVVTGHGERRMPAVERDLESEWDAVIQTADSPGPPDDRGLMIVTAPTRRWPEADVAEFDAWMAAGGRALVIVRPGLDLMAPILGPRGLEAIDAALAVSRDDRGGGGFGDRLVFARAEMPGGGQRAFGLSAIDTCVLSRSPAAAGWQPLGTLEEDTWLDTNSSDREDADEGVPPGASIAWASEGSTRGDRMVVLGADPFDPTLDTRMISMGGPPVWHDALVAIVDWLGPVHHIGGWPQDAHVTNLGPPVEPALAPIQLTVDPPCRVVWTTKTETTTCEPREGGALWCTTASGRETPFQARAKDFRSVQAYRELDVSGVDPNIFGFDEPLGTLEVDDRRLVFGGPASVPPDGGDVMFAPDFYVQVDGRVFVVHPDELPPLWDDLRSMFRSRASDRFGRWR